MASLLPKTSLPTYVLLALVCLPAYSQNPAPPQENAPPSSKGVFGREVFVPDPPQDTEPEPAARSFSDGFLRNARQHFGFSFSAFQTYSPNALSSSAANDGVTFTSLLPQVHANFEKKGLSFRLNYGAAYSRYNGDLSELNRVSQTGSATLSYVRAGRKTTFQITDYLTSIYNDPGSFLASTAGPLYRFDSASQIYIDQRRVTQNMATIGLSYNITSKSTVSITGAYDTVRYSGDDLQRPHQFSVGAGASYQINKWMALNVRYSHYLNRTEPRNNDIQSLQIAGFSFKLGRGWELTTSGGLESTKNGDIRLTTASGQAGISKTMRSTSIGLSYHRGYSAVFPASDVWYGDSANLNLVQRLSSRVSLRANSTYFRGSVLAANSFASTMSGSAGLEVILRNDLVASANYYVVSQNLANVIFPGASLRRHTISAGVQYYLPSISQR